MPPMRDARNIRGFLAKTEGHGGDATRVPGLYVLSRRRPLDPL